MANNSGVNRESWLTELMVQLTPMIEKRDSKVPDTLRISCGFPSKKALARRGRVIGQCWYPEASASGLTQIFISPVLVEGLEVAETTLHEMVHGVVGSGHGHKGPFVQLAKKLGFTKPWTSTPSTDDLKQELNAVLKHLGPYPHGKLEAAAMAGGGGPKQSTRLIKVACEDCGCPVRMTRTRIDECGVPTCGCGGEMAEAA